MLPNAQDYGLLLANIHTKIPIDWYEPFRQKICQTFPILRQAPLGHNVWWAIFAVGESMMDGFGFGYYTDERLKRWFKEYPTPTNKTLSRIVTSHCDFHPFNIV